MMQTVVQITALVLLALTVFATRKRPEAWIALAPIVCLLNAITSKGFWLWTDIALGVLGYGMLLYENSNRPSIEYMYRKAVTLNASSRERLSEVKKLVNGEPLKADHVWNNGETVVIEYSDGSKQTWVSHSEHEEMQRRLEDETDERDTD